MKVFLRPYWFVITFLSIITGCGDTPTCLDIESSEVIINFVDDAGSEKVIDILSLKAIDNELGFPEYDNSTLSILQLPLNPGATATTFIIEQENIIDTLALTYTVVAKLISPECGLDAAFADLDTAYTTYNQLKLINNTINKDITVNIEITL